MIVLMAGQDGEEIYVDPKPVCELLGLTWEKQREKIVRSEVEGGWATTTKKVVVARDGKVREQSLITLETLLMWMGTLSVNRVDEFYRDKLWLYQKEPGKALRRAFLPQTVAGPAMPIED
jgi:hypothetical protein